MEERKESIFQYLKWYVFLHFEQDALHFHFVVNLKNSINSLVEKK